MTPADHFRGKWPLIVAALIGEQYANTRKHLPCPKTGISGKGSPRFRFSDLNGMGHYFCACSDGSGDGFALLQCALSCGFKAAKERGEGIVGETPKDDDYKAPPPTAAEKLRGKTEKVHRSKYLESRGLELPPSLEWVKSMPYYDSDGKEVGRYAAMLAPVTRAGKFLTYHVTYLQSGLKAPVDSPRKMMSGLRPNGGGVELYPPAKEIGVGEGIETCIAAKMLFGVPVWAALSTSLLSAWEPPAGVESVLIFGDHDPKLGGHAAAYALAHKLLCKGLRVTVEIPPTPGQDWNDVLLAAKK